ncbi:hypothetical protein IGI04_042175 [Brassica rapa subsp. trilocularis]|uniref:At3g05675-like ankyrin-like domain-containing protein n=1 Tax=Brassica rapa subsp. trilocularis TaxID=1813537 RepID=A0ABQ7KK25_BRACM|nr:hypothetical protein IGI04_042175 [Brassica rapa subsp. trilocularis]
MMPIGDSDRRKPTYSGTGPLCWRRLWCCAFAVSSASPDIRSISARNHIQAKTQPQKHQRTTKSAFIGRIDHRYGESEWEKRRSFGAGAELGGWKSLMWRILAFLRKLWNSCLRKVMGVYRAIDVLEQTKHLDHKHVAAGLKFSKAILSYLKYFEVVPWNEDKEERLRRVLALYNFDDAATEEILARFNSNETENTQENLSKQMVWSITSCSDTNPRNQLKSLVNGILCKSSVYEKEQPEINKEDIYKAGKYCVDSLVKLFEEGSNSKSGKPLIEGISREGENIIWLLEIMIDWEIAEEFVEIWGKERKLVEMYEEVSPMVRYELSIVTGLMFIEIGKWRVQCGGEARAGLVDMWFKPMLLDFGWLQMGKKGLDMREVEEGMGQTLLTPIEEALSSVHGMFQVVL